ncbi:methionine--tRNA ligase [Aurantiacibacter spongiae]|uniref:Methionine--tRNA ligase n=1 Tax=Aurantiacibacter spongiae TaxID=2488860 RepID=A0A3N5CMU1_9SPHN|nr:methionine--tRNA ligase [Aurantiacibacter spongiae]RPF70263.1 methionine--tRNA ligase [Aurantiacibacter spongiae]
MADPFYITTAIHYPNGRPHIGHAYETIAADVLARFHRLRGREVRFQTGTDEHGLKMAQKARDLETTPRQLADEMSGYFRALFDDLDISYDRFIRTTEAEHHRASQEMWRRMEATGDLYLDRYEGWYSVRDEAYYDESELTDWEGGEKLSPQGTPVEWTVEESWFFRLSAYQDRLLTLYRDNPGFIRPESRRNEILRFVEGGLRDLSISRTSFDWGVRVPGDESHVMYVWVDALTNYLTGLGFPDETGDMLKFWPADVHLIGKDITRFHTVYWPAFLLSAGLAVPRQVFAHGFLLNRGQKESKSLGNVTDPGALARQYGVDVLRYFLLREFSFGQDGSYSAEAIINRANAELANSFGNLAQRVLSFIAKNCGGRIEAGALPGDADRALRERVHRVCAVELPGQFEELAFAAGLEAWMQAVYACNAYVDEQAPWALRKTDPERMARVLATLCDCIRMLAIAISPVIPKSCAKILDALSIPAEDRSFAALDTNSAHGVIMVDSPTPVFPRLEVGGGGTP